MPSRHGLSTLSDRHIRAAAGRVEQLGFGAENGAWRNAFLAGATELRHGQFGTPITSASSDLIGALTVSQVFDSIAIRVDGPRAWDQHLLLQWVITDDSTTYATELRNGVLHHRKVAAPMPEATTFTLSRQALIGLVTGALDLATGITAGAVSIDGDPADLHRLVALMAPVDPDFAIVTP